MSIEQKKARINAFIYSILTESECSMSDFDALKENMQRQIDAMSWIQGKLLDAKIS